MAFKIRCLLIILFKRWNRVHFELLAQAWLTFLWIEFSELFFLLDHILQEGIYHNFNNFKRFRELPFCILQKRTSINRYSNTIFWLISKNTLDFNLNCGFLSFSPMWVGSFLHNVVQLILKMLRHGIFYWHKRMNCGTNRLLLEHSMILRYLWFLSFRSKWANKYFSWQLLCYLYFIFKVI